MHCYCRPKKIHCYCHQQLQSTFLYLLHQPLLQPDQVTNDACSLQKEYGWWCQTAPISSPHQSRTLALSRKRGGVYSSALQILIMDRLLLFLVLSLSVLSCPVMPCLILSCLSYLYRCFFPFLPCLFFSCVWVRHTKQNKTETCPGEVDCEDHDDILSRFVTRIQPRTTLCSGIYQSILR